MENRLIKGQGISLGTLKIDVQVAWSFAADSGNDLDLDVCVFALAANGRVPEDTFFVFYNNPTSSDGSIVLQGDDFGQSEQVDEIVKVDLARVDVRVQEIVFVLSIHDFEQRRQNFGQLQSCLVEIVDLPQKLNLVRYEIDERFAAEGIVELGRLCRDGNGWFFMKAGTGIVGDVQSLVERYCYS